MSPCWGVFSAQDDAGIQPNCTQTLWNPAAATDSAFVRLARPAGGPPASQWSPAFPLFNPTFPVADLDPLTLRPGNDFALYVVDGQLQEAFSDLAPRPAGPLDDTPPSFHDPLGLAGSLPSWATPDPGDLVLSVGFPVGLDAGAARLEHYSVGRVLTDEEARAAIARLDTLGDAEGLLPYASESEFILEGRALPGMSGSGVFDDEGRLVGIVVRASTDDPETQYVRAVRMSWIVSLLAGALSSLSPRERVMMERYLPPL